MYFEDEKLLKKYNEIWIKVSNSMKKEFDSEPIYKKKFWEPKEKLSVMSHDKEIPKVDSNYTCLEVILIDFALKND